MKYLKILILSLVIISCQEDSITGIEDSSMSNEAQYKKSTSKSNGFNIDPSDLQYDNAQDLIDGSNSKLAASGVNYRISKLEYLTNSAENAGQTIFRSDRSLFLESRWVPNDERRDADGNNITYLIDDRGRAVNGSFDGAPPIDSAMETWDSGTKCSNLPIIKREYVDGMEANYVFSELLFGNPEGFTNPYEADIVTTGFLPSWIFDVLAPGGGSGILGVCFTFVFVNDDETPTDIDNNGFADTRLKEIWYNDGFAWSTDGTDGTIDVETVVLHENGHALELGHVGKIFGTDANRKIHIAPRTVMNAFYDGIQREVIGIANSAHCRNFGHWPKK